jgi:nicotinamidase-related amidase
MRFDDLVRWLIMQQAFGLDIPQTLDDVCDPTRLALVVYDMQVGIVTQIENGQQITDKVVQVLAATRKAGIRVFFTRHMTLPKELMGVAYSDDVDGRFQRGVNGHSGHVNKVGAQRRWDYNHARHLRD